MRLFLSTVALTTLLLLAGCSSEPIPELVQVSGTVTLNGKPLDRVRVTFMPNGAKGNKNARTSRGETDANGRFELTYQLPGGSMPGAAVGSHKVVLEDMAVNDSRESDSVEGIKPSRIPPTYMSSTSTKLDAEVKAGEPATFDFEL